MFESNFESNIVYFEANRNHVNFKFIAWVHYLIAHDIRSALLLIISENMIDSIGFYRSFPERQYLYSQHILDCCHAPLLKNALFVKELILKNEYEYCDLLLLMNKRAVDAVRNHESQENFYFWFARIYSSHHVSQGGNPEIHRLLVRGILLNKISVDFYPWARVKFNADILDRSTSHEVDPQIVLNQAIKDRNSGLIGKLLDFGVDINQNPDFFIDVCDLGDLNSFSVFVGPLKSTDQKISVALNIFARNGSFELLTALTKSTSGIQKDYLSKALIEASSNNQPKIARWLMFKGANKDFESGEALKMALRTNHKEMVDCLTKFGANLDLVSDGALSFAVEN